MADDTFSDIDNSASAFIKKSLRRTLIPGTYFTLQPQAISSLDILPKLKPDGLPEDRSLAGASSRANATVYSVLDKCRTVSGRRLLALWCQNPLTSKDQINTRLQIVTHLVNNTELRSICHDDYLRKIPDLLRSAFKISKEKCTLDDLVKIYRSCEAVQTLFNTFRQTVAVSQKEAPKAVNELFNSLKVSCDGLNEFCQLLQDSVELDKNELGEYNIKPNSDNDIARISLEINDLCKKAKRLLHEAAEELSLDADKSIKLEMDPEKGFGLKVTKNNEQHVRRVKSYHQLSTVKKDGYRFTDKHLEKLSVKFVDAKQEYNSIAKDVIADIVSKASIFDNEVLEFSLVVTVLDVFVALSVSAHLNNYSSPLILDSDAEKINIDKLRHPCMEHQPDVGDYIPNDISISKDDKKFYLITGPNMGGKSTFIKSVAVNVIMAQYGSMIPAENATISIIDGVYTRVGAGDRQMDGISTFMEEMMDMATILKSATAHSLVIIDELGRGTSTFDGYGLAYSISRQLAVKNKCYTLFATHFHEMTEMEEELPSVGNLHVKALCREDKLTMLFNVCKGVCDESYGINVAQYTKFPEHVIQMAKEKLKQFEEVPGFSSKKEVREFVRECAQEYMKKVVN